MAASLPSHVQAQGGWTMLIRLYARALAAALLARKTIDFAVEHDLYLLAHSDDAAVINMLTYNPKAKVIWAHTGFSTPTVLVQQMLEKYSTLNCELSYRDGIAPGGRLADEW